MNPQAKAYLESLGFGLAGAVVAAALQSVQAQGFGHLDWAVVGAAALTGALVYLQIALRWLGEPPPAPQPPAAFAIPLAPVTSGTPANVIPQPPAPPDPPRG